MHNHRRLFIVANRLPVAVSGQKEEANIKPVSGGLVSAINSYLKKGEDRFEEVFWAGVPCCTPSTWNDVSRHLPATNFTYLPVMVYKEQYENYYYGFSNCVLWPLFHYFPSFADYKTNVFEEYLNVNEHFADVLSRHCSEDDVIWIHDYHLLPLASMLRQRVPSITVGFFLHIPFPSFELFRLLPKSWQVELLKGMMGADLIGFHTIDYAQHFLQCIQFVLGLNHERGIVRYKDRLIKVDVYPISIDYDRFYQAFHLDAVSRIRSQLRKKFSGRKIILSVDRLDYTKGIQNRLKAYELFLEKNPDSKERVIFIMVVVPSRDTLPKFVERKRIIDELVSGINAKMSTLHWQPIHYQYNSLPFDDMLALYTVCDVALITPLRDGMNLVAKEFVASRADGDGVLVLSEMAGAARELTDALLINPNDTEELAGAIKQGLTMGENEKATRMLNMQQRIANYDVTFWAEDFMKGLESIKRKQQDFQEIFLDDYARIQLLDAYRKAKQRLLFLDYDGTLVPFSPAPQLAKPNPALLDLLKELGAFPGNELFLISGRDSEWLESFFGHLPVHLIAEHGAKVKRKDYDWQTEVQAHSEWKSSVYPIKEIFTRRCPDTFIEEKEFSMVWHYRNAAFEQGKLRAKELASELQHILQERNVEVVTGNKIVEVRNKGVDKGTAVSKILCSQRYDFVFAVGDDKTDEDIFKTLVGKKNSFTIKVGPNASYAQYNMLKPQMVISLLARMSSMAIPKSY